MEVSLTKKITRAGIVAALYTALTLLLAPISFGPVQFRIAEGLTVFPLVFPETAIGLTVGCFISNLFGNGPIDLVLGTFATLFSAILTALVGKKVEKTAPKIVLGELPPIILNALVVPLTFLVGSDNLSTYLYGALTVFLGQLTVVSTLGTLTYFISLRVKNGLKTVY